MKIKFDIKINISKIRGIGHLIAKKYGGLKCIFQRNLKVTTYFTRVFTLVLLLLIQLSLKKMQLGANLSALAQRKKFKDKI